MERYTIERLITRGGMATLYCALDHRMGRRVAMKVLNDELSSSPIERNRFLAEARITAQLDHPNIVPVYDFGLHEEKRPYFTMKLIDGETLASHITASRGTPHPLEALEHLLEVFLKVCEAIAFAHSRGVVHCDLKPANILIGKYGEVYVIDWGLARVIHPEAFEAPAAKLPEESLDETDADGAVMGTFQYMAPEQASGALAAMDERTDVFALGAVLYHILTGGPPYPTRDLDEALRRARVGSVPPPEQVVRSTSLPQGISHIAMKAMAREPSDRYPSIAELQLAVHRFLRVGSHLPTRTFARGALVVEEGQPGDAAYIIVKGTCEAYKIVEGQKHVRRRMGPGEVFGEIAVVLSQPRTASIEALEELTVMVVTADTLLAQLGLNSWFGLFVKALAERFRDLDQRLARAESKR